MSLATRCASCGTIFRVVQDQLKVSEGWVRCGRCKEVFNALENLFELERETPPEWQPLRPSVVDDGPAGAAVPARASAGIPAGAAAFSEPAEPAESDEIQLRFPLPPAPPRAPAAEALAGETPVEETADEFESAPEPSPDAMPAEAPAITAADEPRAPDEAFVTPSWAVSELPPQPEGAVPQPLAEPADAAPAFLRERDISPTPRRRIESIALSVLCVVLVLALALQMVMRQRDALAARSPGLEPLLAGLCRVAGCRIEPPRRIDDIAVESSALTQAATRTDADAMRLSIVLRNRANIAVAAPTLDLSLTDSGGALVARRAFAANEFQGGGTSLAPLAETTLQLLLSTGGRRVSGYTVEIFYP